MEKKRIKNVSSLKSQSEKFRRIDKVVREEDVCVHMSTYEMVQLGYGDKRQKVTRRQHIHDPLNVIKSTVRKKLFGQSPVPVSLVKEKSLISLVEGRCTKQLWHVIWDVCKFGFSNVFTCFVDTSGIGSMISRITRCLSPIRQNLEYFLTWQRGLSYVIRILILRWLNYPGSPR